MASVLVIIQDACHELGISAPTAAFTNTNLQIIQLCGLANREGRDLFRKHTWQRLTKQISYTTVAQQLQTSFLPTDFDRFIPETLWNSSTTRKIAGPMTQAEFQQFQAYPIFTSTDPAYIMYGNDLYLQPAPAAGETIIGAYISKNWAATAAYAVPKDAFTIDTDVTYLPDTLVTLGIIWRFKKAKGLDYSEEYRTYQQELAQKISADGSAPKLNLTYGLVRYTGYWPNTPSGNFPSS